MADKRKRIGRTMRKNKDKRLKGYSRIDVEVKMYGRADDEGETRPARAGKLCLTNILDSGRTRDHKNAGFFSTSIVNPIHLNFVQVYATFSPFFIPPHDP